MGVSHSSPGHAPHAVEEARDCIAHPDSVVIIGDRVTTPIHGAGVIVNLEHFDKFGEPIYTTENPIPQFAGTRRWGVKLDTTYFHYKDNVAYYVEKDLRNEH